MKVMTRRHIGVGHKVLKSFCVHAVLPIEDYVSVTLIATVKLRENPETVQKEAARNILGNPS